MLVPTQNPHPLTQAVLAQLNAEIRAHGQSVKSVAIGIDRNYDTIRRYVAGEKDMPVDVLWAILDYLQLAPDVFLKRSRDRRE